ncbi:MAG: hypothetical protein QOG04_48 [Actinomycetota bacterium]|jgi:hypothetical protein|nr:hypothetical protein [Actinomycetota bacterium]
MTNREKELERALAGFEQTGDEELDSLVDTADQLTRRLAVGTPAHPQGRALFIEGVAARKRSFMSSLVAPAMAATALLMVIAVIGRSALPGESLYPVRKVLGSAGLATASSDDMKDQLQDAELLVNRAQAAFDRGSDDSERFAVAALMSLGRAENCLKDVEFSERPFYEAQITTLQERAVVLIRLGVTIDAGVDQGRSSGSSGSGDDNSGSGSGNSGSDDNSGSGSDDSGSGSDDSGSGSDNSGSGSDDSGSGSDDSGSGSDSSGSGSGSDDRVSGSDSSGPGSGSDD